MDDVIAGGEIRARFRDVTDRLRDEAGVTVARIAEWFQIAPNTISRWRSDSPTEVLRPREGWEIVVARGARGVAEDAESQAGSARRIADELDPSGSVR